MVICEILLDKWWITALMKPGECGLLKSCIEEELFINDLKEVMKVLKLVFSNKCIADVEFPSKAIKEFVIQNQ